MDVDTNVKILILGAGKSGTTALTYCLQKQLPDYPVIFEPPRLSAVDDSQDKFIVKFVDLWRLKVSGLSKFDRKILIVRHPFDRLISFLLYIPYRNKKSGFFKNSETQRYIDFLKIKTNSPDSIPLLEIIQALQLNFESDFWENLKNEAKTILKISKQPGVQIVKYEDFVDNQLDALENYLGLTLNSAVTVPQKYQRVERTKKYDDWKNWFTPSDIQTFNEIFTEFNRTFGYSTEIEPNWVKKINPEQSYLYTIKVINEARRKHGVPEYQPATTHSKRPQVSVIVPAYQGDRYLDRAISSVLQQTFTDWEIIVVDDGSTDRTRQALQPHWDKIRYVYQENQGVAAARNRGIALSRGRWVAFLDQDDEFLPDKLAAQIAAVQNLPEDTDVGIIHSGWQITGDGGGVLGEVSPWLGIPELTLASWVCQKPVFLGAMLFDRLWLAQAGGFDTGLQQTSDVDLVLRLAAIGCGGMWVRQPTVRYRQHDRNVSRNAEEQAREMQGVLDRLFRRPHLSPEITALEGISRYQSWVWSAARLHSMGDAAGMVRLLEKSLPHSPYGMSETILDWVQKLGAYGAEYGQPLDAIALTSLPQWQQLMMTVRQVFAPPLQLDRTI